MIASTMLLADAPIVLSLSAAVAVSVQRVVRHRLIASVAFRYDCRLVRLVVLNIAKPTYFLHHCYHLFHPIPQALRACYVSCYLPYTEIITGLIPPHSLHT
jgi:hypothetical protein